MGLSWQQGPLLPGAIGRFPVPEPLPKRLLYAEPLRRRMRVRFGGSWIADSEGVFLLFEPRHYPIAYLPETDVSPGTLQRAERTSRHPDLGLTSWYTVRAVDGVQLRLEPGQSVIPHGPGRDLTVAQVLSPASGPA